jgi:hypothetical protein
MATSGPALSPVGGNVVTVTINLNSKGEVRSVDPDKFEITKAQHQQLFWQVSERNAHFNVEFTGDSPFDYKQFSDAEPYSGLVRREVLADPNKYYTYNVTVTLENKVASHKGSKTGNKGFDPGGYVK